MKSFWQPQTRAAVLGRLEVLTPEHRAQWGRFTAPLVVAHLSDALRMAFGDLATRSKRLPVRHPPLKQIVIYWLPMPKGLPTAAELISRAPAAWEAEMHDCRTLIERFGRESPGRAWPDHPAFGTMTARQWGVITYRHTDHHLSQFGV
ncbi:MAG: DUF1569 domain-containing protein [Cytophagaceae bacterium]|nr:DUF1569 domain-containing protein [Gemmatimonadaceae bacterium]